MRSWIKVFFTVLILTNLTGSIYASESLKDTRQKKVYIKDILVGNIIDKNEKLEIEKIIKPYLNTNLSIKDIESIRSKLNSYYKNHGFIFTKVLLPPQDLSKSVLRFTVIRAKAGKIKITGNKYYSTAFIKKNFDIKEGEVLNYDTMMKSLLLLNEYEDLKIKSYLKKGSDFSTTDITLEVKDKKPSHLNVSVDNLGSKDTSKYRASVNFLYGNMIKDGDKMTIDSTLGLSSTNTKLIRTNYLTTAIGKYHTKLNLSFLYASYIAGGDFSVLDIKGDTFIYTLGVQQPILRSIKNKLDLNLNYSKKDIKSYLLGALSSKDELNIIDMELDWQHKRIFDSFEISTGIAKGFGGDGSFGGRLNENVDFLKYSLNASYNRYINTKNNILISLNSQYSTYKLPLSEMFTLGGLSSVRGFDTAEKLGDKGYTLSAEWFYHPDIKNKLFQNSLQIGLFVDHGAAFANQPVPGESKSVKLTGGGVELIAKLKKRYFGRICLGFPINSSVSGVNKRVHIYAFFGAKIW